jgi:hypothetical protein
MKNLSLQPKIPKARKDGKTIKLKNFGMNQTIRYPVDVHQYKYKAQKCTSSRLNLSQVACACFSLPSTSASLFPAAAHFAPLVPFAHVSTATFFFLFFPSPSRRNQFHGQPCRRNYERWKLLFGCEGQVEVTLRLL